MVQGDGVRCDGRCRASVAAEVVGESRAVVPALRLLYAAAATAPCALPADLRGGPPECSFDADMASAGGIAPAHTLRGRRRGASAELSSAATPDRMHAGTLRGDLAGVLPDEACAQRPAHELIAQAAVLEARAAQHDSLARRAGNLAGAASGIFGTRRRTDHARRKRRSGEALEHLATLTIQQHQSLMLASHA